MSTVVKDLGAVSAYAYAAEKGYTGTEAEFAELMADYAEVGQRADDAADSALESKTAAQTAATTATNKATEATTAATTATTKAGEASTSASTATSAKDTAVSAASTATTKATEATTAAATAVSAKDDAVSANTAAQSAKTAAQTAQTGAETAAASVEASAEQIATNAEDISQLKSDLDATTCSVISVTHGKYLTGNGVETTGDYPNYCIVYFDVADLDDLHVNVRANTDSESTRFVFYDSENAILQIIRPTLNSDDYNQYSIPTGASKFGVTVLTAKLEESFAVVNVKSVNEKLNDCIDNLYNEKLNGTLIAGKYVNYNTGSFDSYNGWSMTDYIDVSSYDELLIYSPKATQYVAFYDSGKNHITYNAQSMNLKKGLGKYAVPQNAKYYIVSNTDAAMADTVIYSHYGENQEYIETSINAVNGDYLFSLFNKVVCIGDSLTRGYRYEYPEGSKNADYGYPEYLAHMTNSDVSNYGQSGDDPTEWYEYYENTDFSSYDCALICFGRNGYLLSETDRTNYQNIITKLKTENPHMTIFILSVPPSDVDGTGNSSDGVVINVKIKAIADANNLPYIDLLTNSDVQNNSYRSDGIHYYTLGYLLLAREIMRRVDLFIFENQSEFMQTWVPSTKPPYPPAQ